MFDIISAHAIFYLERRIKMIKISMREFTHDIAEYMNRASQGEEFVVMKRNQAIADIIPHSKGKIKPGWSLNMPKKIIQNEGLSDELVKFRQKERS